MATQYTAGITQGQAWTAAIANQIGAVWETWTPVVKQPSSLTLTNNVSRYMQIQKLVIATAYVTITGTGTAPNGVLMSLPITAKETTTMDGFGWIYDASATTIYNVTAYGGTTEVTLIYSPNTTGGTFGNNPSLALANNDQIRVTFVYEAA